MTAWSDCRDSPVHHRDSVAWYYASEFAWPVIADSVGVWLRLGEVVDALVVGAGLGARINTILLRNMLGAPVIDAGDGIWIFLTQLRTPLRQSTWDHLARIPVRWPAPGSALRLPNGSAVAGDVQWQCPPVPGRQLPPWTAVVGAARSCVPA